MIAQKNHTLELLKLFASYMVVFIHVSFTGKFGTMVDALARFAVPFFFWNTPYGSAPHKAVLSPAKTASRFLAR